MTTIGLLGDTHSNTAWVQFSLTAFKNRDITTILQLGDFGIWPGSGGEKFVREVNSALEHNDQTLHVILGNHEDMDQVAKIPVSDDGWQHLSSRILLAPRGHRWTWDERTFVALGGAPSVDRWTRVNNPRGGKSWWAEEALTADDVAAVAAGGYADVMVCHDAPDGVQTINQRISGNPHGFKAQDLEYAAEGRALMTEAFKAVAPKILLHGHYHFLVDEVVDTTHVLGLSCDNTNYSLGLLDTASLSAVALDIQADYLEYTKDENDDRHTPPGY